MARILIIEDNEYNLYLETFILEKHGHHVIQATNGDDGIILANKHIPDLILLDIQLPGMDGYEVARHIRSNQELNRIPMVAVTSHALLGDRENILAAGCNDYIEKPINPDTFMDQIAIHIRNLGGSGE